VFQKPPVAATQSYVNGLTEFQTSASLGDHAGYSVDPALVPALDRTAGFTLTLRIQLVAEQHTSQDRAGFSVLILGADKRGIELGFWPDRVWAQNDSPLFTHAEETLVNTTAMTTYELVILGDTYTLRGGGATLSGPVRSYQASVFTVYRTSNFIFLGDNTTSGGSLTRIAYVALEHAGLQATDTPTATSTPPPTGTPTAPSVSPSPTSTVTASPTTGTLTAPSVSPSPTPTAPPTSMPAEGSLPTATSTATRRDASHAVMLPLIARP
jgi:hypothetical protein